MLTTVATATTIMVTLLIMDPQRTEWTEAHLTMDAALVPLIQELGYHNVDEDHTLRPLAPQPDLLVPSFDARFCGH